MHILIMIPINIRYEIDLFIVTQFFLYTAYYFIPNYAIEFFTNPWYNSCQNDNP